MRYGKGLGCVGVFLLASTLTLRADVWDLGTENDDVAAETDNHLIHGAEQVHDLAAKGGVADEDWFMLKGTAYSSYEVLVDGMTADLDFSATSITRRDAANPATVLQTNFVIENGRSRAMLWQNTTATATNEYLLIGGAACGTTCTANTQYRVRLLDTTYVIPRFNNANSQVTVLLVQNSSGGTVPWTANYWSAAGTLLAQVPGTLGPRQTAVVNLSTIPALQNQTGAITITHLGGYGGLATKSVALEPATGFSFDTLGTYRSR